MRNAHPEYLALLDGILDNPGDDDRRLVFADFLEENGEEDRASFIRAGVLGEPHWPGLLTHHGPHLAGLRIKNWGWAQDDGRFRVTNEDGSSAFVVSRGFPSEWRVASFAQFKRDAARTFAWLPITSVRVSAHRPRPLIFPSPTWTWWKKDIYSSRMVEGPHLVPEFVWVAIGSAWQKSAVYDSEEDAWSALSNALLLIGMSEAKKIRGVLLWPG